MRRVAAVFVIDLDPAELLVLQQWVRIVDGTVRTRGGSLTATEQRMVDAVLGHQAVTTVDGGGGGDRRLTCTTAEAGRRLGLTRWAVRKAIIRGDLTGSQACAGGPYRIDEQSIAAFEARRVGSSTKD
jgi:hypothetical protein